ncbi:MAG: mandelate racemase/muconate lactonizing enzyme family protein, partial [Gammaproteobacteria bacterium]|nr:mandelate racemase/muconate lactonizing enzyme family protein [Gammaproteobacteria bacterium]
AQIAPHIYCGPIAHAAAVQVAISSPAFLILETIQTEFHDRILTRQPVWQDGYVIAPTAPGLGIEIDLDVLLTHPYTPGGRLHLEMCQSVIPSDNTKTSTELAGDS